MSGNENSQDIRKSYSRDIRSNYSQDATITIKNTEGGGVRVTVDYGSRGQNSGNYAHRIAKKMVESCAELNKDVVISVMRRAC